MSLQVDKGTSTRNEALLAFDFLGQQQRRRQPVSRHS